MSLKEGGAYFESNSMLGGSRLFQVNEYKFKSRECEVVPVLGTS